MHRQRQSPLASTVHSSSNDLYKAGETGPFPFSSASVHPAQEQDLQQESQIPCTGLSSGGSSRAGNRNAPPFLRSTMLHMTSSAQRRSRSGGDSPGATEALIELEELGAAHVGLLGGGSRDGNRGRLGTSDADGCSRLWVRPASWLALSVASRSGLGLADTDALPARMHGCGCPVTIL